MWKPPWKYKDEDILLYHKLHIAGESVLQISERCGISRKTLCRRWKALGLSWRDPRAATTEWISRRSPEEIVSITKAAHDAVRGMQRSEDELRKRAASKNGWVLSKYEAAVLLVLLDSGYDAKPNFPEGKYNIDIALPDIKVAIEVDGGNWHTTAKKMLQDRRKENYLYGRGWKVVRLHGTTRLAFTRAALELVSHL